MPGNYSAANDANTVFATPLCLILHIRQQKGSIALMLQISHRGKQKHKPIADECFFSRREKLKQYSKVKTDGAPNSTVISAIGKSYSWRK